MELNDGDYEGNFDGAERRPWRAGLGSSSSSSSSSPGTAKARSARRPGPILPITFVRASCFFLDRNKERNVQEKSAREEKEKEKKKKEEEEKQEEINAKKAFEELVHGEEVDKKRKHDALKEDDRESLGNEKKKKREKEGDIDPGREKELRKVGDGKFAMEYLKNLGFKGRLGKDESGISKPIEVAARENPRMGIGAGGKEKHASINEHINIELFGSESDVAALRKREERKRQEEAEEEELRQLWKKAKAAGVVKDSFGSRPKRAEKKKYRTAAELVKSENQKHDEASFTILDMRGGQVRYVSNLSELNEQESSSDSSDSSDGSSDESSSDSSSEDAERRRRKPKTEKKEKKKVGAPVSVGEELAYNLLALVSAAEGDVTRLNFERRKLEKTVTTDDTYLKNIKDDADTQQQEVDELQETIEAFEEAYLKTLSPIEAKKAGKSVVPLEKAWVNSLQAILPVWDGLPGIHVYNFEEDLAAIEIFEKLLQRVGNESDCLFLANERVIPPGFDVLRDLLGKWVPFLKKQANVHSTEMDEMILNSVCLTFERDLQSEWNRLNSSEKTVYLKGKSDAVTELESERIRVDQWCLSYFDIISPFLSQEAVTSVAKRSVLGELERRVENWNVKSWGQNLDVWILPWVGLLGRQIRSSLHRRIRQRLVHAIETNCSTAERLCQLGGSLVRPWQGIFSTNTFRRLVVDGIVPKALRLVHEFEVNPVEQDLGIIETLVELQDVIPSEHLFSILEAEFFPKWLKVLAQWLSDENPGKGTLRDVARWMKGWSILLEPLGIRNDNRTASLFGRGVAYLASKIGQEVELVPAISALADKLDTVKFEQCIQSRESRIRKSEEDRSRAEEAKAKHVIFPEDIPTIEFLNLISPKIGVTFMRDEKGRVSPKGRPIYVLAGKIFFSVEKDICYMAPGGNLVSQNWSAIEIETLLSEAQKIPPTI